jgi:hypothetical protein
MIKTYRGILADGAQNKIRLSTKKGKIGYKIVKLEIMPASPGLLDYEALVKLFKITQTSITGTVDFSDGNLLAAAFYMADPSSANPNAPTTIMFEQEIFNQDVFITYKTNTGSGEMNYYLELETMTLSDNAATVSTLRDIRLNPQVGA